MAGVRITLWRDDGDGALDEQLDTVEAIEVTDSQGSYGFGHPLPPGTFFVDVDESTLPARALLPPTTPEPEGPLALASLEGSVANFGYQFTDPPTGLSVTGADIRRMIAAASVLILAGLLILVRRQLPKASTNG
jgi:hypothetical protein